MTVRPETHDQRADDDPPRPKMYALPVGASRAPMTAPLPSTILPNSPFPVRIGTVRVTQQPVSQRTEGVERDIHVQANEERHPG